jgi:hypothetical protein
VPRAELEAHAAEQRAAEEQGRLRLAELSAQWDEVEQGIADQRRRAEEQERAEEERRRQTFERVRAFINEPPPHVPMSLEEQRALRAQLDRDVARDDAARAAREEQERREEIDREWRRRQARTLAVLRAERDRQQREA